MDQTCPHCHKLVVLPELIRNYRNMPIRCHSCETAFFLPDEAVDKINGAVVKRRCKSCKLSVYLPELRCALIISSTQFFIKLARHYGGRRERHCHWRNWI
ncbi:MAG: hypothetical protein O2835_02775 [Proteobacteria bacterium]|nr:hypothetical protein [Pseudomonadota bacterium]MDA0959809.1 hypothetical protein [Pseudomonadota bacterium]MDA1151189.1 hypothetical protein [Pseudomonadota bacterium]